MVAGQCTLCSCSLTADNNTEEHIILNAIGGRKKVLGFICQTCNSDTGLEWDDDLARQLNSLSIHLGIKRQRGQVPPQAFPTASGQNIRVNADGTMTHTKPEIKVTTEAEKTRINITARSRRELRQTLEGLKRRYPKLQEIDLDELILESYEKTQYNSDAIKITPAFGGIKAGRSLVKSAVALVFDAGIDPTHCDLALDYLLHEGKEPCFGYYYDAEKDIIANRPPQIPLHCVYVKGSAEDSTILGYVEFFGLWRMVLCLSQSYTGKDFTHVYAIDPVKGQELGILVNFDLSLSDVRAAYEYKRFDDEKFIDSVCTVFDLVQETGFNRALDQAITEAVKKARASSGITEGEEISDEQRRSFTEDLAANMRPFIIHNMPPTLFLPETLLSDE